MRILITGGTGLVGSAFQNIETDHELILFGSDQYNLIREQDADDMIYRAQPDAIIHLAAKVGGVKGNSDYVEDFFYDNMVMNLNVLNWARIYKVPKVLSMLSTCVYPDDPSYPLTEDQIHAGEPHQSNFGYAYAKRMLEVHSRAIRQQYGLNYITAVPNNIYGPGDNFDLENGHVVPAIFRKLWEANLKGTNPSFWGTGAPLREFTYSKDIARALLLLVENYEDPDPINIGTTGEISIFNLVSKVADSLGIDQPKEIWDTSKPEGQFRKPSCNKKFIDMFPDFEYTDIETGLKETADWFKKEYPNVRGI
jgi:GDP-L-fucose synthase